jgi:hypothetical protein
MKSLERLFIKSCKEAIKSSTDVSDIIPSDTLDILTQDESSIEKQIGDEFKQHFRVLKIGLPCFN